MTQLITKYLNFGGSCGNMFKTYFCKIDDFPGVKVNPQGKIKPLAESCDFNLKSPYAKAKKKV